MMAAISSIPVTPLIKTISSSNVRKLPFIFSRLNQFPQLFHTSRSTFRIQAAKSLSSITEEEEKRRNEEEEEEEAMSIDNLQQFIKLSLGKWNGTFYQFDSHGKLLQEVTTKLSVGSYGEDELISLIQTLYIKQPSSSTSISGYEPEIEWAEYKIKETNMFTVDKYQQIGFFPKERAFALRYQTAGMLDFVLRQGVLGEDDTGEESPKNLKLPSRRPSIVCESCLYSREKDMRARAFHILDPQGVLEMLLVFLEDRGDGHPHLTSVDTKESTSGIMPFLGRWEGHSITKRSGVYGATIAEADTVAFLEMNDKDQLIQDITTTSSGGDVTTNVHWTGTISDRLVTFDGGFQMTLLPGGMYMSCPCNVANSVAESKSFHLEFCWMDSPGMRQRLIRTYDVEGLAVSSTYISETKV
ncbi:putative Glutamate NMDA receptor subunit epsilon-1 [Thalictrum thalictroides]|uniref:Putative Glutamate NMDA receptor subunit epsilon-1 n=1 Tax=Thalictrum thalictroides TaxID=46969 RepID=A0A7J6V3T7_THATH|nr:putative Glutamate NMDA receptor subunit epsilon-1 [Thalictrum thalictroides]